MERDIMAANRPLRKPTGALDRWSSRWARPFLASAFSGFHGSGFQLLWVFSWVLRPLLRTLRRFFGFFFLCGAVTRRFHLLLLLPPFRESSSESAVRRFLRFFSTTSCAPPTTCLTSTAGDIGSRRHQSGVSERVLAMRYVASCGCI